VEKEGNKEERRRIASMMTICRTATAPGRELSQHFDIPAAARKSIISTKKQFKSFFFFFPSLSLFFRPTEYAAKVGGIYGHDPSDVRKKEQELFIHERK
jgi:hypothetical protein